MQHSGRISKQEQWKRWRGKRKLVSGKGAFAEVGGYKPRKNFEIVCAKSSNLVHFARKMVRNAVDNAFLNTNNGNAVLVHYGSLSTMGTAFRRVNPLK